MLVAKKRTTSDTGSKPDEKQEDRHRYPVISLRAPDDIRAVLIDLARQQRRSISQTALFLIEEALTAKGLWQRPSP